ncbi:MULTISPECIES: hypothetical protein [unclassified Mycolicibacterium]|uniref:hypothetical protein n=1 Tax=unclassified Mycolicibacterium TaxID=2636767 RepID=UPI002ED8B99C
MKIVTNVADGSGTVELDPERVRPVLPEMTAGEGYRHEVRAHMLQPALGKLERSRDGIRLEVARRYAALSGLNWITRRAEGDRVGIVASGKTSLDLAQAIRTIGLDEGVRILQLRMIHLLEPNIIAEFAEGLDHIVVLGRNARVLQAAYFIMAVRAVGLAAGPQCAVDAEGVDREFFADGKWKSVLVMNIGYPSEISWADRLPRLDPVDIVRWV